MTTDQATRDRRAAAAPEGCIAADPSIDIAETPDVDAGTTAPPAEATPREERFAEAELAGLPLVLRESRTRRVKVWRDGRGRWWRRGGSVRVQPVEREHGAEPRAFVVTLHEGANEDDLRFLLNMVKRARTGAGWDTLWRPAGTAAHLLGYDSRLYADPYSHSDSSARVAVCDEPRCVHRWHLAEWSLHQMDEIRKDGYVISVERAHDEDSWRVAVDARDFAGTPAEVAAFINDVEWARRDCERANAERTRMEAAA